MQIRALTEADRPALAEFACARPGEPWSKDVQQAIREDLADRIAEGRVDGFGLLDGERLRGVAEWRVFPGPPVLCQAYTVAVAVGEQRKGYGRALKQTVLDAARAAGAVAVSSIVDRRNVAMLALNEAIGATVEYPDDNPDICYCFFRLT